MVAVTREVEDVEEDLPARRSRFDVDIVVLVTAAIVLLVPLAAVVSALRNPWIGLGDWVKLEQNVRDVGTGDTPLVGAWSRFGWDHPGPWPFYLMAPFYRLAGAARGLLFATAMVNLLVVVGYVLVVLRYPRMKALVALVGLAVLLRGMGVGLLLDPWNPWMAILPFALFLLLAVEVAEGRRGWVGVAAAAAGSLAMQAHLGLVPPVALIGATALVLHLRAVRREHEAPSWRMLLKGWIGAAAVLVAAWLPVIADQLVGDGNLGKLARWIRGDELVPPTQIDLGEIPNGEIPRATAWLLDPIGLWTGRFSAPSWGFFQGFGQMGAWRLLLVAALPAAAALLWWRNREAPQARSALTATWLGLTGVVATVIALITWKGQPFLWGVRWVTPIVMLLWIGAGWAVAAAATRRWPWLDTLGRDTGDTGGNGGTGGAGGDGAAGQKHVRNVAVLTVAAVVVAAVPAGLALGQGTLGEVPGEVDSEQWQVFGPRARAVLEEEPVIVIHRSPLVLSEDTAVLELYLDRAGVDWIDVRDPEAAGHPSYFAMRLVADENGAVDMGPDIVASADEPTIGPGLVLSQLVLVRQDPQDPADVGPLPEN